MGSEPEPAKQLLPYLQRADELQKHEPLVAYYCRLFAMEKGLKIPAKERTKTTNSILVSLMNQLEKDKKSLKLGPDDNLHVEGFASSIFAKADKQDRAGRADLNTAKTFYAAYVFFEILSQFGELQPDIEQKMKYAVWKAADIRKALKEGRRPEPGPPGGDQDLTDPSSAANDTYEPRPSASLSTRSASPDELSSHLDKDLGTSASFSTRSTSSVFPSGDIHHAQVFKAPDSEHAHLHRQQSYPTERSMPQNYSPHEPQNYSSLEPQNYHFDEAPSKNYYPPGAPPQSYPAHDASPSDIPSHDTSPSHYPSYDASPSNYPSHDASPSNYPSRDASPSNYPTRDASPPNYPTHEASQINYPPQDGPVPPYTYPNFQTYPSFHDSTLPAAPTHYPIQNHSLDAASVNQSFPATNYAPKVHFSGSDNGTHLAGTTSLPPPAVTTTAYTYDSNYQPSVEKIADAHKAARFAVGALAFDDVPLAVDFLRRSLELLTNPSAESHH